LRVLTAITFAAGLRKLCRKFERAMTVSAFSPQIRKNGKDMFAALR
jgi:hypothetical protein